MGLCGLRHSCRPRDEFHWDRGDVGVERPPCVSTFDTALLPAVCAQQETDLGVLRRNWMAACRYRSSPPANANGGGKSPVRGPILSANSNIRARFTMLRKLPLWDVMVVCSALSELVFGCCELPPPLINSFELFNKWHNSSIFPFYSSYGNHIIFVR